ncbi:hypothetical protein MBH78_20165 [Oceanimonas sp. NS1]|nr:hypothetical protein [Oceanimonas sp. NS1]
MAERGQVALATLLLRSCWFAAVLGAGAMLVVLLQSRAGQLGLLLGLLMLLPLLWQTLAKTDPSACWPAWC